MEKDLEKQWANYEYSLKYDSDWVTIMRVIEKIEQLGYNVIIGRTQTNIWNKSAKLIIDANFHNTFIENAADAIGAFAVWYNK